LISLAPRPVFDDFGTWTLAPALAWPQAGILVNGELRDTRKQLLREAPQAPGVYGMVDSEGELIYTGESKSLRNRLVSYFAGSAPRKARRIIAHTRRLFWESAPDQFAALLRELELIRRWRPRFNVRGQPNRHCPAYLVLGRGPASHAYLATSPAKGDTLVFGPLRASRVCRRAVRALNDYFQLRACGQRVPARFADQREMFLFEKTIRCFRYELGNCLAPCACGCSSAQYTDRVRAAKRFLGGTDLSALTRLEEAMITAAAAQRYEEAAVFRDAWETLKSLYEQWERFRVAQRHYSFIYPVPNQEGGCSWYLIQRGQVHAVIDEPRERRAAEECLALMERIYTSSTLPIAQAMYEDVEVTLLVAAWFHSRPHELQRTLLPESAEERLREVCSRSRLQVCCRNHIKLTERPDTSHGTGTWSS
jgi:excinuclease ABC subunit C